MTTTTIRRLLAWEALDSRGRPTVGCRVELEGGGAGRAIIPSGASTGGYEARELRDGGLRFGGYGVTSAVDSANGRLSAVVVGLDACDYWQVDRVMEDLDPDPLLGSVGANAVLGISLATVLALADQTKQPLWRLLSGDEQPLLPRPMVNVISGGVHAGGALDIQDVLIVPLGAESFSEAIERCWRVRDATAEVMSELGIPTNMVADEGGLSGGMSSNEMALQLVTQGIERAGLSPGIDAGIAVDVAANQFFADNNYHFDVEHDTLNRGEWLDRLSRWCAKYPVVSLEDPLHEDDWLGWHEAAVKLGSGRQLIGDDLFATNLSRLEKGVAEGAANAILIKPNQAGTVSRAHDVLKYAHGAGFTTIVSARSGDTEDYWLADLAVGWHAGQLKVGSTHRSERTSKWNRLLEIEAEFKDSCALWNP